MLRPFLRVLMLMTLLFAAGNIVQAQVQNAPSSRDELPAVSVRQLPKNLFLDQKAIWTTPARFRARDFNWTVPLSFGLAGIFASDTAIQAHAPTSESIRSDSRRLSTALTGGLAATAGGMYVWGQMTSNPQLQETGLLSAEATVDSLLVATALKGITGRERPDQGDGSGRFWTSGSSFPSNHSIVSWTIASVIAHEYPGPMTKFLAYGTAAAVSATRVTGNKHFTSDVLVGAALGWYIGDRVYASRAHEAQTDQQWGTFQRSSEADRPRALGSTYVPLDSWVYPAFDRLASLGYLQTAYAGLRPWTRAECARLVQESADIGVDEDATSSEAVALYRALAAEFAPEARIVEGDSNTNASIESVYTRYTGISGTLLNDSYHFAQTITNNYGRPYGEGSNVYTGISGRVTTGPFALYVRGEYQRAGDTFAYSAGAQQAIAQADGLSRAPLAPDSNVSRLRLLDAYVALNLRNNQLSFGNQSSWWGPGEGGPLMFSNNAEPVTMLRLDRISPFKLPSILGWLGPVRTQFFIGRLAGHQFARTQNGEVGTPGVSLRQQPYIHGEKIAFKPTPNFEFSVSRTVMFGGPDLPVTLKTFWRSSVSGSTSNAATDPGDRRNGFDFSYRVPGLRDWLTVYTSSFTDDQPFPLAYPTQSAWAPGFYLPKVPGLNKLDFRAEGALTPRRELFPGFFYFNVRYVSGYTNDRQLLGNWIGRQGSGVRLWSTYWFSPRSKLQVSYRGQWVDRDFLQGGWLKDVATRAELSLRPDLSLSASLQYERWRFPLLSPRAETNVATSVQLTYSPHWRSR